MTTNRPNVKRYDNMGCPEEICRFVETMSESDDGDYVLYEDYEALQAECEKLRKDAERYRWLRAIGGRAWTGHAAQKKAINENFDAAIDDARHSTNCAR